ncbi:MAG TPA: GyrI-like domain-containing protein, partial [Cytophagaceae bacterium]|nr:GyrI-like domain-containing protein [Cytophagaceae bacterium]
GTNLYSMQLYEPLYFDNFNPENSFEKWAAIEVTDFRIVPHEMETIILQTGLYAVFMHKGAASEGIKTFQAIFSIWLPGSDYRIDNRPHFEVLGEKYKNEDPSSEEEIWIPIRPKKS